MAMSSSRTFVPAHKQDQKCIARGTDATTNVLPRERRGFRETHAAYDGALRSYSHKFRWLLSIGALAVEAMFMIGRVFIPAIALACSSIAQSQVPALNFKPGRIAQASKNDSMAAPLNVNTPDLGNAVNVVAPPGRNIAYFSSSNSSTAPWFVIRDGYTGTRGKGAAGDGNGPFLDFQSANSAGTFRDSAAINCGLTKATAGAEQTDCDLVGIRNGSTEVMLAVDASRPALIPGDDHLYQLGDLALGGNHSLNRFSFGYFSGAICVGCSAVVPKNPFQAVVANNSNVGVYISSEASAVRVIGSLSGGTFNSAVKSGDSGIIAGAGGAVVVAVQNATGASRWSSDGTLTQTGPLVLAGPGGRLQLPGYKVATLPVCNTGTRGSMAYVTDSARPNYNEAVVGGGSVITPVFCNGSGWIVH